MKPSMGERGARERTCGVEDRDGEGAICHSLLATHLVYRLGRCVVYTSLTPGLRKEHGPEATLSEMVENWKSDRGHCSASFSNVTLAMAEHELPIYDLSLPALHAACVDNRHL